MPEKEPKDEAQFRQEKENPEKRGVEDFLSWTKNQGLRKKAVAELFAKIAQNPEKVQDLVDEIPDKEKAKKRALEFCVQHNLVQKERDPKTGSLIVDLEKLATFDFTSRLHSEAGKLKELGVSPYYAAKKTDAFLMHLFGNEPVIDKNHPEEGAKPLTWYPQNEEEAFNLEAIKRVNVHILPSDLHRTSINPWPTLEGGEIKRTPFNIALDVFHPQRGAGRRNKDGILMIKTSRGREKISAQTARGMRLMQKFTCQPVKFLQKYKNELVRSGLFREEDFRKMSTRSKERGERFFKTITVSSRKSGATIEGVSYYLGAPFAGKKIKIVKISERWGGIVSTGKKKGLTHIFPLLDPEERERRAKRKKSGEKETLKLSKKETQLEKYNPHKFYQRRADETDNEYQERINSVEGFAGLLKLENETGINLNELSLEEQNRIGTVARKNREKILALSKKFGRDGLRAVALAAEYGEEKGEEIFAMVNNLEEDQAEEVFAELAKFLQRTEIIPNIVTEQNFETLKNKDKEKLAWQLREALLRRSKDILLAINESTQNPEIDSKKIITAFKGLNLMSDCLEALFAKKGGFSVSSKGRHLERDYQYHGFLVRDTEGHDYKLNVTTRPRSTKSAEARINFALRFDTENPNPEMKDNFNQTITQKGKTRTLSELRLGFDLDNYYVTSNGQPLLSLDLGREKRELGRKLEGRSGDPLGNALAMVSESGAHNIDSFELDFSREDFFAEAAEKLQKRVASIYQDLEKSTGTSKKRRVA